HHYRPVVDGDAVARQGDHTLDVIQLWVVGRREDDNITALDLAGAVGQAIDHHIVAQLEAGLHAHAIHTDARRDKVDGQEQEQGQQDGFDELEQKTAHLRRLLHLKRHDVLAVKRADVFWGMGRG